MKKTLTLLAVTTVVSTAISAPAWSAMRAADDTVGQPFAAVFEVGQDAIPLVLASGDDDDDREYRSGARHDNDDNDDDCDGEEGDVEDCAGNSRSAAPAGTVAPPQNGLFGNGAPPKVQMN